MTNIKKTTITIAILFLLVLFSGCIETLSKGKHSGQITAVQKEGLIWQTWDVYVKTDISSSQEDKYCVEDESLIPQLYTLSENRTKITLLYRGEFYTAPWRCSDTRAGIITGIER